MVEWKASISALMKLKCGIIKPELLADCEEVVYRLLLAYLKSVRTLKTKVLAGCVAATSIRKSILGRLSSFLFP